MISVKENCCSVWGSPPLSCLGSSSTLGPFVDEVPISYNVQPSQVLGPTRLPKWVGEGDLLTFAPAVVFPPAFETCE